MKLASTCRNPTSCPIPSREWVGFTRDSNQAQNSKGQPKADPFSVSDTTLVVLVAGVSQRNDLYGDFGQPRLGHIQLLGCSVGEIDDAAVVDQIAAIGDPNHHGPLVLEIDHAHPGAKRQRRVASGHCVHVEPLPTRRMPPVEYRAIPGRNSTEQLSMSFACGL